jgi:chromosome segregation ATPase
MKSQSNWLLHFFFLLALSMVALAQSSRSVPTLTTDDIVSSRPLVPPPASTAVKPPGKVEKNSAPGEAKTDGIKSDDPKKNAEQNWNERLRKAQEKAQSLAQQADQVELAITQLRNQLFSAAAKAPEANGQINARITQLFAQMYQLRADAKTAQQEVETLQAEGDANQYQVQAVSLTNNRGEPDKQAYQKEYNQLQSELRAAHAREEVLQLRLNTIHSETLRNANGDNFTLNRLRAEKEQTAAEWEETRAKIATLTNKLQAHRQKAAAAGISLSQ